MFTKWDEERKIDKANARCEARRKEGTEQGVNRGTESEEWREQSQKRKGRRGEASQHKAQKSEVRAGWKRREEERMEV